MQAKKYDMQEENNLNQEKGKKINLLE